MALQNSEAMISMDMPAGPSEVLVIADAAAPAAHVAADLLSQAEHGPDSQASPAQTLCPIIWKLLVTMWQALQHPMLVCAVQMHAVLL